MDVFSLIYEALQILYAFIPKELVIIILSGLTCMILLNKEDKDRQKNEEKNKTDVTSS